jgi:hypothetical protein
MSRLVWVPLARRFMVPVSLAAVLAAVFVVTTTAASACYPLCVLYTDSNPEWYLFFCYLC